MEVEWKAQQLRFTAILAQPYPKIDYQQLWREAIGSDAGEVNSSPKSGVQTFQHITEEYRFVFRVGQDRIDILFQPIDKMPPAIVPNIGLFPSFIAQTFKESIQRWISADRWPYANRVAIGANLAFETPDAARARQIMSDMVPSLNINVNSTAKEILFQINRPRVLSIRGSSVEINRIAKWSSAQVTQTAYFLPPSPNKVTNFHMALLELDISTPVNILDEYRYNAEIQAELVNQLTEMAVEISQQGDIEE